MQNSCLELNFTFDGIVLVSEQRPLMKYVCFNLISTETQISMSSDHASLGQIVPLRPHNYHLSKLKNNFKKYEKLGALSLIDSRPKRFTQDVKNIRMFQCKYSVTSTLLNPHFKSPKLLINPLVISK